MSNYDLSRFLGTSFGYSTSLQSPPSPPPKKKGGLKWLDIHVQLKVQDLRFFPLL